MYPGALARRALVALACLVATAGTCHATIILGPIAPEASILQLPDVPSSVGVIVGDDPTIGRFTFTGDNRLSSDSATDQVRGSLDFEGLDFQAANPGTIVGLSFEFGAGINQQQFVELTARDQSGTGFRFLFPGPIFGTRTVSLLATGGETISGFRLSSPILGSLVGPFRVVTAAAAVPEPSTLALGAIGLVGLALGCVRRGKRAAA